MQPLKSWLKCRHTITLLLVDMFSSVSSTKRLTQQLEYMVLPSQIVGTLRGVMGEKGIGMLWSVQAICTNKRTTRGRS